MLLPLLLLSSLTAPDANEVAPRLADFMQTCQRERGVARAAFEKHLRRPERARTGWMVVVAGKDADERRAHAAAVAFAAGGELQVVAMSSVVGKYVGETEKNLDAALAAAATSGAVLFFDEADALFRKRTDVKDSHDKYANQEVSYLYTRLLALPDLVVLGVREPPKNDEPKAKPRFDALFTIGGVAPPDPVKPWARLCWPSR